MLRFDTIAKSDDGGPLDLEQRRANAAALANLLVGFGGGLTERRFDTEHETYIPVCIIAVVSKDDGETVAAHFTSTVAPSVGMANVVRMVADSIYNEAVKNADPFPQPLRKDGGEPCAECHIQPGETCDICGAVNPAPGDKGN